MKFAVTIFTMLLAAVGGLIFVQYQGYTEQKVVIEDRFHFTQEIEVEYRNDSLDIRHHFKNLPEQEVDLKWPVNAVDAQCFLATENACKRLNETVTKIKSGDNKSQSISYVIPLPDGLQSGKLLKDVFVQLEKGQAKFSTVHITTSPKIKGAWVTGLPLIGYQQLSLVNYAMFSGEGNVRDLYWQRANFTFITTKDSYTFASNSGVQSSDVKQFTSLKTVSDDHISIVKVQKVPKQQGYRILFVDHINPEKIQNQLTMQQLDQMYTFEDTPVWLKQLIGSVVAGKQVGFAKSETILAEIRDHLSEEQYGVFVQSIKDLQGQVISPSVVDEQLSQAVGAYTKYISLNVDAKVVYPFVYNDARPIILNGKEQPQLHVLLKDGRMYYPADALLQALGYKTSEGANGYYVNDATRAYRFPQDEHQFYVFNQRRFNISTSPFKSIANIRYIDEAFVEKVFLVNIDKTEDEVKLTTTEQIIE